MEKGELRSSFLIVFGIFLLFFILQVIYAGIGASGNAGIGASGNFDLDVLAVSQIAQTSPDIYLNNGSGNFTLSTDVGESNAFYSVAVGDFDGDGDLDSVGVGWGFGGRIYLNDGSGNMAFFMNVSETDNTNSVAVGDFDGDGDLDYIAGNNGANRVYVNNGSGNMTLLMSSSETDNTYSIAVGDLDNDGDLDYIAGNYGEPNRVYLNNGTGGFILINSTAESDFTTSVAIGDLDGDGDLDYIAGNYGEPNRVYLNNGTGGFILINSTAESDFTTSVAIGDLDGDGDLDFVVGIDFHTVFSYGNNGTGGFILINSTDTDGIGGTGYIRLGDLDNDGDLDVFKTEKGWHLYSLLNNGSGSFTQDFDSGVITDYYAIALGDFDGDGSATETNCFDGIDNDLDGWIDAQDSDCAADSTSPTFTDLVNVTIEYGTALGVDLNATDETSFDCWDVNDTTNFKINCSGYLENNTLLGAGLYNINLTINDSTNNINSDVIWVNVTDTTAPIVTISSPTATTYTSATVSLDLRLNEAGYCEYSLDSGVTNLTLTANSSNTGFTGTSASLSNANYVLSAYCNDSFGNNNYTTNVSFTINVASTTGGSSTGGGSSVVEDWVCGDWGDCIDGIQTKQCTIGSIKKEYTQRCDFSIEVYPKESDLKTEKNSELDFKVNVSDSSGDEIQVEWFFNSESGETSSGSGSLDSLYSRQFSESGVVEVKIIIGDYEKVIQWNVYVNDEECSEWSVCLPKYDFYEVILGIVNIEGYRYRYCNGQRQTGPCILQVDINPINYSIGEKDYLEIYDEETGELLSILISQPLLENSNLKRLDLRFLQNDSVFKETCFNEVQDGDEEGIDCGGEFCRKCVGDYNFFNWLPYAIFFSWFLFVVLLFSFFGKEIYFGIRKFFSPSQSDLDRLEKSILHFLGFD
jgi:hypothetical protein